MQNSDRTKCVKWLARPRKCRGFRLVKFVDALPVLDVDDAGSAQCPQLIDPAVRSRRAQEGPLTGLAEAHARDRLLPVLPRSRPPLRQSESADPGGLPTFVNPGCTLAASSIVQLALPFATG